MPSSTPGIIPSTGSELTVIPAKPRATASSVALDPGLRRGDAEKLYLRPVELGIRPGEQRRSADRGDIGVWNAGRFNTVTPGEARRHIRRGLREMPRDPRPDFAGKLASLALDVDDAQGTGPVGLARDALSEPGIDDLKPAQRVAAARIAAVEIGRASCRERV